MSEYKQKNIKELAEILSQKRVALRDFRFGTSGSKTKNVKEGRGLRKEIARILTEITAQKNK